MIYYLVIINIISYIAFGVDKRLAESNGYRISEKCLLFLSLIGGCFGGMVGMYCFHHKTKKDKFKILIPLFVIIWIFVIESVYAGVL